MENNTAILRINNPKSKNYNDLYRHISGNRYKNLRTGAEGDIPEQQAKDLFVIDYNATMLINSTPLIESLIYRLGLRVGEKIKL